MDHHLPSLGQRETAKAAWDALEAVYKAKSMARRVALKREMNSLKKAADEPMTKYVARAKELRDQLAAAGGFEAHRRRVPLRARARGAQGRKDRVREDQRHAGGHADEAGGEGQAGPVQPRHRHGLEAAHASIDRPSGSVVVHDMRPRR